MKFLHLSDLHIGKTVNGFSMLDEQRRAFEQIIGYVRSEAPAAVLIAGDVYDRAVPGVEAVRAFDDFLTALACEDVTVMIVAGNHDSPERLSYASRILSAKRLHICGTFDGQARRVTLTDRHGGVHFWLLPFIRPSLGFDQPFFNGAGFNGFFNGFDASERNVLVSHQFYTKPGLVPVRSESEINPIGGLDAIDAGVIEKFDYAALGHLHGAQTVGSPHIRYAGSPVKYSFSEWRQKKSVTLVELNEKNEKNEKGGAEAVLLPLTPLRDMREIKGRLDDLVSAAAFSSSSAAGADSLDYLRVILTDDEEIIDPIGKLRGAYPNIMSLDFENSRTGIDLSAITAYAENAERTENAESTEKLQPGGLFGEFFLDTQGSAMSAEQAAIVTELMELELYGGDLYGGEPAGLGESGR